MGKCILAGHPQMGVKLFSRFLPDTARSETQVDLGFVPAIIFEYGPSMLYITIPASGYTIGVEPSRTWTQTFNRLSGTTLTVNTLNFDVYVVAIGT